VRDTAALDGATWSTWCDGGAARRAAAIVARVAASTPGRVPADPAADATGSDDDAPLSRTDAA
jgi:hypothetical protein